jgi:hypothetical protein
MRVDSYFNFPHYRRRNSLNERTKRVKLNLSANKSFIKSTQGKLAASVDSRNVAARAAKIPCEFAIILKTKKKRKKKRERERETCTRDLHIRTRSLTDAYLFTGAVSMIESEDYRENLVA